MSDQDTYSDDYNSDEFEEELKQPKTKPPSSKKSVKKTKKNFVKRPKSAEKAARELWLNSVKNGPTNGIRSKSPNHRITAQEQWSQALRRTGVGITPQTMGSKDSFSGLPKGQMKNMSYGSTSHYLRQLIGTEKPKRNGSESPARLAPGTPAYKSQEEYYEEVLTCKKQIAAMNTDNSQMKSRVRMLEEDNLKKERQIEQLLDPSKSDELRRTLADKKPDAGSVIYSLKRKILKLEHQMRDKEAAFNKLQSDLKTTKIEEMRVHMETFYLEVQRLHQVKTLAPEVKSSRAVVNEKPPSSAKLKALQETIIRMNEKNVRLQQENKTLKQDLEQLLQEAADAKEKYHKEYEDMSKRELMSTLSKLEKKLDRVEADRSALSAEVDNRADAREGKIVLEGSMAQKLDQLDKRETELLDELEKQRDIIKRLKEDRAHYRKKGEEKDKEIKTLKKDVDDIQAELDSFYDKDKSKTPGGTPRSTTPRGGHPSSRRGSAKKAARSRSPSVASDTSTRGRERREDVERHRKAEELRKKNAAKHIQRSWRKHNTQRREEDEAADMIGGALRGHMSRKARITQHSEDEESEADSELDSAAEMLQANVRGYWSRKDYMQTSALDLDGSDTEAVVTVQSSMRGHLSRKLYLSHCERDSTPSVSRQSSINRRISKQLDSEGEEEDEDLRTRRPSLSRRTSAQSVTSYRSAGRKTPSIVKEDSDSDEDIVVSSRKR